MLFGTIPSTAGGAQRLLTPRVGGLWLPDEWTSNFETGKKIFVDRRLGVSPRIFLKKPVNRRIRLTGKKTTDVGRIGRNGYNVLPIIDPGQSLAGHFGLIDGV